MREMGIKAWYIKPYIQTTIQSNFSEELKNILDEKFNPEEPNSVWCSDITYIWTYSGFVYLTSIMDLFSRKIIAWVLSDTLEAKHVVDAIEKAKKKRNVNKPKVMHADRGIQYTNRTFHSKLESLGMTQSMSRVAKCIDNGPMEGFWGIIKRERYYGKRFTTREAIVEMIENYITYYNNRKLQRNLGVMTPMEKHEIYLQVA